MRVVYSEYVRDNLLGGWGGARHSLCRPLVAAQRPAQLVLCRIAVPTTPAQTVSWSIPIVTYISGNAKGQDIGIHGIYQIKVQHASGQNLKLFLFNTGLIRI